MSQSQLCRLCVNACEDYKSLYDEKGLGTEFYEIILKYFHPMILDMEKWKSLSRVCIECWRQICDFHEFQAAILVAQSTLSEDGSEVVVKEETSEFCDPIGPSTSKLRVINEAKEEFISFSDAEKLAAAADGISIADLLKSETGEDENMGEKPSRSRTSLRADGASISDGSDMEFPAQAGDLNWSELELTESESDGDYTSDYELPGRKKSQGINQWTRDGSEPFSLDYLQPEDTVLSSELELTESEAEEERIDAEPSPDKIKPVENPSALDRMERNSKREYLDQLVAKYMPNIQCVACPETYTNLKQLQAHFRQQHPKEKFYVLCCNLKLPVPTRFREHLIIHSDPEAFKCQLCGRTYSLKSGLLSHMALRHPEAVKPKTYSCKKCNKSYDSARRLSFHVKVSHVESEPGKRQRRRRRPRKSRIPPDGPGAFTCAECGKIFDKYRSYTQHQWYSHRLQPKHTCVTCGKSFKLKYDLRKHVAVHTGYSCAFCHMTYTNITDLHLHRNANHPDKTGSSLRNLN